jgi:hypothetical protein
LPHILYPWQAIQDVGSATPHIYKFLAVAEARKSSINHCLASIPKICAKTRYTHGKERIDLKPELICIAAPKDFEEGFQVLA